MKVKYKRFTDTNENKIKEREKVFENDWNMREETRARGIPIHRKKIQINFIFCFYIENEVDIIDKSVDIVWSKLNKNKKIAYKIKNLI